MAVRRWLPYGALALGAHVAAVLLLRSPGLRNIESLAVPAAVSEIDVESLAPKAPAPPPPPPTEAAPAARIERVGVSRNDHASSQVPEPLGEGPVSTSEPATTSGPSSWTFDPRRRVDLLARGVPLASREAAASDAPGTASTSGGLIEGLDARDAAMDMARGGPALSALEASATGEGGAEGTATFDVTIDSSGAISVALLSASTSSAAWARVGQAAGASLDPKRIRIPPGAKGWRVVASVEAKVQYPNGVDPKTLGTHLEAAGPDLIENEHRASVGDSPLVFKKPPGVAVVHSGKVCTVKVGLGVGAPISGGCDLTNVGAVATRVVRSHVVSEGRL